MGSSGNKNALKEIIYAFNSGNAKHWSGIMLSPRGICPIEESINCSRNPYLYITDMFVPAAEINKSVDLVICHDGQCTLQTAIASGTPIVGIATKPEQKINLEHLHDYGSAIRIPAREWNKDNIVKSVNKILQDKSYKEKARELSDMAKSMNSGKLIADKIWERIIA